MKKLTALAFSAAIAPAFVLGTAAFAQDREDNGIGSMERADQQQAGEQRAGEEREEDMIGSKQPAGEGRGAEQHMTGKPAGAVYADDLIGNTVKHRGSDQNVGTIQDLVIDEDGRIVGVVVTTGGFLGLGGQDIGLGWDQIEHVMEDDESVFYTDMDEEALRNTPEYERD